MKRILTSAFVPVAFLAFGAVGEAAAAAPQSLDAARAGRTAGAAVPCINQRTIDSSTVFNGAIVYRELGGKLYVNKPDKGRCTILTPDRQLVTRTAGTQLCRLDSVRVVDLVTHMEYGSCTLDDFVPYAKQK
jgi:hypothetical protein